MEQSALTLVLPVRNSVLSNELKAWLKNIGERLGRDPEIDFRQSGLTHFARFVIIPPISKGKEDRLFFSCCYDGDLQAYINELILSGIAAEIDKIFLKCSGYKPGTLLDSVAALSFLTIANIEPAAYFVALRGATQKIIADSRKGRELLDAQLDAGNISPQDKILVDILYQNIQTGNSGSSTTASAKANPKGIGLVLLDYLFDLFEWVVGVRYNGNNPRITMNANGALYEMEDLLTQNQMTVIVPVKESLKSRLMLRVVLFGVNLAAKFTKNGSLSDLTTIHFARWVIIDNGKNLLFESNFDGSWKNYIDDFVDHASTGMNLIWANCVGFPLGGSKDIESFKTYIRNNQHPAQLFYSSYKESTVRNILTDLSLSSLVKEYQRENGRAGFILGYYGS